MTGWSSCGRARLWRLLPLVWALTHSRGQALTEFALAVPILVVLTLGVGDGGRAFFYKEAVTNTARQAIRLAAQNQAVGNFACGNFAGGGAQAVVTRNLPDTGVDAISNLVNTAALETSSDGTTSTSVLNNPSAPTRITLTWNCSGPAAVTNAIATSSGSTDPTSSISDSIRGQIDYSFKLITPFVGSLFAGQTVHIGSDVRGRAEY